MLITGAVLVILTWTFSVLVIVGVGLTPALLCTGGGSAAGTARRAVWWGLLIVTVFAMLANLAWPLRSASTAAAGLLVAALLGVPGWITFLRRFGRPTWGSFSAPWLWVLAALLLAQVFLAFAALGPVTNYDSGLYHLGAISYAGDFATIPGLANLYFPFGYGNAEFPLAALLGNGPWGEEGFRLLNGLVMLLVALELALRLARRRLTPGTFVLAVGVAAAWVPLVALSDYWVTSPTQDSSVFVLTMVAVAYLCDAVLGDAGWVAAASTGIVVGILLVTQRPTMTGFVVTMLVVLAVRAWRSRGSGQSRHLGRAASAVGVAAVIAASAATARDVVLSGWLQYPLSVVGFDVPWRAPDPGPVREATLGFARNPQDAWNSVQGWDWVGPWLARLPAQWETYELMLLAAAACAALLMARRRVASDGRWPALIAAMVPSAVSVILWWALSPPSLRFMWGAVFSLAAIPLGWSLWLLTTGEGANRVARPTWAWAVAAGVALPIVVVTCFTALVRADWSTVTENREWVAGVSVPYAVAPVVAAPTDSVTLPSGLQVLMPSRSDQCWGTFPLCTPQTTPTLELRGETIQEGFLP